MFADGQATHLNVEAGAGAGEVKIEDVRSPFTSNQTDSRRRLAIVSLVALCLFGSVVAFIASHGSAAEVSQQAHKKRDAAFIAVPGGGKRITSEGVQMNAGYGGGRMQGRGESREEKELRTQPAPGDYLGQLEGDFMDAMRQQLEKEAAEVGGDDTDGNAAPTNQVCCASRSKFERWSRSSTRRLVCSNIPVDCCLGRQEQGMKSKSVIPCLQKKHKDFIDNHQKTYGFLLSSPNLRWRPLSQDVIAKKNVQYL